MSNKPSDRRRTCLIGKPIGHSLSPLIHNYWLEKYAIDGDYSLMELEPDQLGDFVRRLPEHGFVGANVTHPYKLDVIQFAAHSDPSVTAIGAANTIWFENGQMCAGNSDGFGYGAALDSQFKIWGIDDWSKSVGSALVIGAGGAARAVVHCLIQRGIKQITLVNRSSSEAEKLVSQFLPINQSSQLRTISSDALEQALAQTDLLINATPLGMKGYDNYSFDINALPANAIVSDLIYSPLETKLLADARRANRRTVNGLGMLLHQARLGFRKWYGHDAVVDDELIAYLAPHLASH